MQLATKRAPTFFATGEEGKNWKQLMPIAIYLGGRGGGEKEGKGILQQLRK